MKKVGAYLLTVSMLTAGELSYPEYLLEGTRVAFTSSSNMALLGAAALSVFALADYDDDMQRYSQEQGLMSDALSRQLDLYGGRWAYPTAVVLSWLAPGTRDARVERLKFSVSAIGVTATATSLMKWLTGRERPNGNDRRSFPSGHTSGSFAVATVVEELYGESAGAAAYVVAGLVGAHRIHENKHWLTDVIAGAALGTVIGRGFAQVYRETAEKPAVSLIPERNEQFIMVTLVIPIN